MNPFPAILLLVTAAAALADTRLAGSIRDPDGAPVAAVTLHFYRAHATGFDHVAVTTGDDGSWSIDLPPGEWRASAHSDAILARGFFCFPGFVWCGEAAGGCGGGIWPPLWGGGLIDWTPVIDPGEIDLTLVPTRPDLGVKSPRTAEAGVVVSFETTTDAMTTIRQWRIEKSTDLRVWTPMRTVPLSGASPVIVPDPDSTTTPVCHYRAVRVEDVIQPVPAPDGGASVR